MSHTPTPADQWETLYEKARKERDELVAALRECEHVFALEGQLSYILDQVRVALAKVTK
jgi:hypothetical protein